MYMMYWFVKFSVNGKITWFFTVNVIKNISLKGTTLIIIITLANCYSFPYSKNVQSCKHFELPMSCLQGKTETVTQCGFGAQRAILVAGSAHTTLTRQTQKT